MSTIFGFESNATVQPVIETGGSDGGFSGEPTPGTWVADGPAVDVVKLPLGREEKNRAGIDVDPEAHEISFNLLPDGSSPITTRSTVQVDGAGYNVKGVEVYDNPGFNIGIAQIVRL